MNVHVHFFARAKDLTGVDSVSVALTPGARVGDLRQELISQFPALAEFLDRCAVAVDNDYATNDTVLSPEVEAAVLPPVSGGM